MLPGDPGSATAAVFDSNGLIRAYLNATPATPDETLANWTRFRIHHNAAEERHVRLLAARTNVARGASRESCVTDRYATTRTQYEELACIVTTPHRHPATVLVAAAQPKVWSYELPTLIYALDHFS
jgi:hypothetical protein